jgi:hypothetical protein
MWETAVTVMQLKSVNFGRALANATGSTGVGYTVFDETGAVVTPRTTVEVYQMLSGSGMYSSYVNFPNAFHGSITWDTGTAFPTVSYAIDEFNIEANDPNVLSTLNNITDSIKTLVDVAVGRWKIVNNQMIFYDVDNENNPIVVFNLYDSDGNPSSENVFERRRT